MGCQGGPCQVLLLVDTHIDPDPAGGRTRAAHARVEEAIAMAASVAGHALDQGVSVGLLAWGGTGPAAAAAADRFAAPLPAGDPDARRSL